MADPFDVKVVLPPGAARVSPTVFNSLTGGRFNRQQAFQDGVLNHEQGHYNIAALLARDFFVDVMLLKGQPFASVSALAAEMDSIKKDTLHKEANIQLLYDKETASEHQNGVVNGPNQLSWNRFIQTAFTRNRASGTRAPDGTPHKAKLGVVLRAEGKRI